MRMKARVKFINYKQTAGVFILHLTFNAIERSKRSCNAAKAVLA